MRGPTGPSITAPHVRHNNARVATPPCLSRFDPSPNVLPSAPRHTTRPRSPSAATQASAERRGRCAASVGGRGSGFGLQEAESLLEILEEFLPLCQDERDHVASLHSSRYPRERRTMDSLKRKFSSLHRKRIPTGDPMIPNDVKWAKKIRGKMTERADLSSRGDANELPHLFSDEEDNAEIEEDEARNDEARRNSSNDFPEHTVPVTGTATARALVHRRPRQGQQVDDLLVILKLSTLQGRERREEERHRRESECAEERDRREEERARREEDRAEERARRQEDRKSNE